MTSRRAVASYEWSCSRAHLHNVRLGLWRRALCASRRRRTGHQTIGLGKSSACADFSGSESRVRITLTMLRTHALQHTHGQNGPVTCVATYCTASKHKELCTYIDSVVRTDTEASVNMIKDALPSTLQLSSTAAAAAAAAAAAINDCATLTGRATACSCST